VNLIQVDAVVTDRKGQPVPDLQAEDFEILQDGKPQPITHLTYIQTQRGQLPALPYTERAKTPNAPAPPVKPLILQQEQVRRSIVMVVDSLGISGPSVAFVRNTLRKFIEQQIQPNDLSAILRTGTSIGALQQFTSDKRLLLAAVERVRWNAFSRAETDPTDTNDAIGQVMRKHLLLGSLDDIKYVVNGMREMPGRKSVVLFTEDMRLLDSQGQRDGVVVAQLERLADTAHRAGVVIYSIDPRGLPTLSLQAKVAPPPIPFSMSGNADLLSRRRGSGGSTRLRSA
jgi:VWFA-related protein